MTLVLDFGSGNTCRNDKAIVRRMIEQLAVVDKRHLQEVVIKWQLFGEIPPNLPLEKHVFKYGREVAEEHGYQTTASVFRKDDLRWLLEFQPPFVKIACRPALYWLANEVPYRTPVWVSWDCRLEKLDHPLRLIVDRWLACVPEYPASVAQYGQAASLANVSDHTVGWDLLSQAGSPEVWEKHYRLPESTGPDAGPFAVTPEDLAPLLGGDHGGVSASD